MGRCKQKQRGLRGLLCRWLSITEWEMYITAQGCRLRNDLYCVEWDVKLYYTIPVSGKITPAEVTVSSWGSVCVPGPCPRLQRQRWQWAWLKRQQASSNFHLTASLLKRPFASAGNATSEPSVSQREHRKRYRTFALRNLGATLPGQVVHTCPVPLMLQLYGAIEI